MEKTLDKFLPGESGKVKKISGEGPIRRRLFDMGITPGARIYMRKSAPLGDPIEVNVRGYELSIRLSEAAVVTMDVEEVVVS